MFLPLLVALSFFLYPDPASLTNQLPAVLVAIAQCESGDGTPGSARQFDDNGEVLTGPTKDRGYFQISPIWNKTANKLGYDIRTEKGNISMALWIYNKYGTKPWNSSKKCWLDISDKQDYNA